MRIEFGKGDTDGKDDEGHPLGPGEGALEEDDGKDGGGQDFELVADLVDGGVEVGEGDVEEVVLDSVEEGRDGEHEEFAGFAHFAEEVGEEVGEAFEALFFFNLFFWVCVCEREREREDGSTEGKAWRGEFMLTYPAFDYETGDDLDALW